MIIAWKIEIEKNLNEIDFEIRLEEVLYRWIDFGFNR